MLSSNINKQKHEDVEEAVNNLLSAIVYWLPSKAHAIFHPKEDEMVLDAIKKQIEILRDALSSHFLYASVIEGDAKDLTTHRIISVREQCQILSLALSVVVGNMPVWKIWNKCCEVAAHIA